MPIDSLVIDFNVMDTYLTLHEQRPDAGRTGWAVDIASIERSVCGIHPTTEIWRANREGHPRCP